jgi:nucleotide-binding universal stress UspA family protein
MSLPDERSNEMYDRLLVPTDGSDGSDAALRQAVAIATRFEAVVDVVAVVDRTFPAATVYDHVVEGLESAAEAAIETATAACAAAGVEVEPHLRRGVPHEEIVSAAETYGSDLVVIGTHGRTGVDRLRHLGSVAERVVRLSPVPVLVTPLDAPEGSD